jgi:hypothetical protein
MAIQGLGSRALAGRPGSAAKAAAFDRLGLQVTPENVLAVYQGLATEAARLNLAVQRFQLNNFDGMPLAGDDPISYWAKTKFDQATGELFDRCVADVDDLRTIVERLRDAAIAYGKSEKEISHAFNPVTYRPPPTAADLPRSLRPAVAPPPTGHSPTLDSLFRGGAE